MQFRFDLMMNNSTQIKHCSLGLQARYLMAAVVAFFLLSSTAQAASFPCKQAKSKIEKTICGDPELSVLDEHLGRYYSAARLALKSAGSCLVGDQKNWLRTRRDTCTNAACLRQVYLRRLAELDLLQPGVTSIRNITLPRVKALVWIVPPALDQVAAPPSKNAKPYVIQGTIQDEVVDGDGYFLRTKDGRRVLMLPLMFIESPTTEVLTALARDKSFVEARGFSIPDDDGSPRFSPDRCLFVYRGNP